MKSGIDIVFTDFDGTLLSPEKKINERDLECLFFLEKFNIIRVIATGRTLYSIRKILVDNFPIDYIIFSTGSGIINWKTKEIIYKNSISTSDSQIVLKRLIELNVDFTIQLKIPDNHHYLYYQVNKNNNDFNQRNKIYQNYCKPLIGNQLFDEITQFLIIIGDDVELFTVLYNEINSLSVDLSIIRSTSPIDGKSIWIEIFSKKVSKKNAALWLCNHIGLEYDKTLSVGNDFNDEDLLDWTTFSYVVNNAPEFLKMKYKIVSSNSECGFSDAVRIAAILP